MAVASAGVPMARSEEGAKEVEEVEAEADEAAAMATA